jgi:hypothetical protein
MDKMQFYHVDRECSLEEGQEITLKPISEASIPRKDVARELYPEGVTSHGEKYLSPPEADEDQQSYWIEAWCEVIRLLEFPEKTSRFQSVFGCETPEAAEAFAREFSSDQDEAIIWKVKADNTRTAEMGFNQMGAGVELLSNIHYQRKYWEGEEPPEMTQDLTEVLAEPPVRVLNEERRLRLD